MCTQFDTFYMSSYVSELEHPLVTGSIPTFNFLAQSLQNLEELSIISTLLFKAFKVHMPTLIQFVTGISKD